SPKCEDRPMNAQRDLLQGLGRRISPRHRPCGSVPTVKIVRRARLACIAPGGCTALWLVALMLVGGCGRSMPVSGGSEVFVKQDLLRGVRQIHATHDRKKLHAELIGTLARLQRAQGTTAAARRGRELAIQGFEATLQESAASSTSTRTTAARSRPPRETQHGPIATSRAAPIGSVQPGERSAFRSAS